MAKSPEGLRTEALLFLQGLSDIEVTTFDRVISDRMALSRTQSLINQDINQDTRARCEQPGCDQMLADKVVGNGKGNLDRLLCRSCIKEHTTSCNHSLCGKPTTLTKMYTKKGVLNKNALINALNGRNTYRKTQGLPPLTPESTVYTPQPHAKGHKHCAACDSPGTDGGWIPMGTKWVCWTCRGKIFSSLAAVVLVVMANWH